MSQPTTGAVTVTAAGVTITVESGDPITVTTVPPPVTPPPVTPPPAPGTVLTGRSQIIQGDYLIQADQWNSPSGQLKITTSGTGAAPGFRITADTENVTAPGAPGSYPSIVYGYGFAGPYTPNCKLPLKISALTPGLVMSAYETTQVKGAAFDCSYDCWFAHSGTPVNQNAGLELMIWLNWGGGVEAGGPLHASNVTIGGNTYNIYYGTGNAALGTVYALSTTPLTSLTIDMYDWAKYIVSQGWLASTDYLIGVEAGFETWHGNAGAAADSFSVTIGGTPAAGHAKVATLQDTFPGTTLNAALWTALARTGAITVNNGLAITGTASSATYTAIKSAALYDLTASQIAIELVSAGAQGATTQALLQMQDAATLNALQLFVQNGNLIAQKEVNGTYTRLATVTYNAAAMKWLRLREAAGITFFEYAATSAGPYTVLSSVMNPITLTALYVFIQQGQYGGADAVATSQWANLNS
jgi:Glycosyl hydrolase family 12